MAVPRRSSEGHPSRGLGRRYLTPHRAPAFSLDETVSRRDALLLLLLSAIWGSSFLFIKLGVDALEPSVVVLGRLVIGVLVLLPLLRGRGGLTALRGHLVPLVVLGALNNAVPFWLLGFAETRLDSGLTAVIQAAAPIFTVLLATRIDVSQRVTGVRLIGVGIGFVGVALLVGVQHGGALTAAVAVIAVALCYAASVLYAGRTMRGLPPLQVSIGQLACAAVLMAPLGSGAASGGRAVRQGHSSPSRRSVRSGSGIAYLLYFALIASAGRVSGHPRHLPRAGVRARLRCRVPRRGSDASRTRRSGTRPRRHGSCHGPCPARRR